MASRDVTLLINARDNTKGAFAAVNSQLGMLAKGGIALAVAFKGIDAAVAGGTWITKLTADAEQANVAFRVLLGGQQQATKMMGDLTKFASNTPYGLQESQDAARALVAFGIEQEKVMVTMRRIGDVAAATGQPFEDLARVYGTIRAQGRMFAQDMNQFTGRGIPIIDELAKNLGVAKDEIKSLVTNGQIGFAELEAAFASLTENGGRFAGLMAEQAKTLHGQWAKINDDVDQVGRSIGKHLMPAMKLVVDQTARFVDLLDRAVTLQRMVGLGPSASERGAFATHASGAAIHSDIFSLDNYQSGKFKDPEFIARSRLRLQEQQGSAQSQLWDLVRERNGDTSPETRRMAEALSDSAKMMGEGLKQLERDDASNTELKRMFRVGKAAPGLLGSMIGNSPFGMNIRQMGGHAAGGIESEFKRLRGEFFMNMLFPDGDKKKKKRISGKDPFADPKFERTQGSTASDTRLLTYSSSRDPTIELHRKAGQQRAVMVKELKENNQLMKRMMAGAGVVVEVDDWGFN